MKKTCYFHCFLSNKTIKKMQSTTTKQTQSKFIRELAGTFVPIIFGILILIFCMVRLYASIDQAEKIWYFTTIGTILGLFIPSPVSLGKVKSSSVYSPYPTPANTPIHWPPPSPVRNTDVISPGKMEEGRS